MIEPEQTQSHLSNVSFQRDGYFIARQLADTKTLLRLNQCVDAALNPALGPVEYEADVGYSGAPSSRHAEGGQTPRRLLHAYSRDQVFRDWATQPDVVQLVALFLGGPSVRLALSHHNCVMTKHPEFSSQTSWHQDNRYWSYDQPELISVWLALGNEQRSNGGLFLIPGSHRDVVDRGRLDKDLFLRPDVPANQEMINKAVAADLDAGDVLFFHSRTFHAAGENTAQRIKKSLVFTYHVENNYAIPGTKSERYPSVPIPLK
ncbi:MAG: phytanoyl-CoA dioxygenase family protein [Gammaproteobacteria bacterium]|nr:phytanoyl-CoA dioxygenase family protein [Gammaproteobacteria bacterium]